MLFHFANLCTDSLKLLLKLHTISRKLCADLSVTWQVNKIKTIVTMEAVNKIQTIVTSSSVNKLWTIVTR